MVERVMGIDLGFSLGWGVVEFGKPTLSGTYRVPGSVEEFGEAMTACFNFVSALLRRHRPDVIIMAELWVRKNPVPTAQSLQAIFAFHGVVQMAAYDLRGILCLEENEARVRGYWHDPAPRGTDACKRAALQFCADRGWPAGSHHAADALVMAAYGLAIKRPDRQHELLPAFISRHERAGR